MDWKKIAKVAKFAAYAVVPGAAGYVAYRYVIRPWLDKRSAKNKAPLPTEGATTPAGKALETVGKDKG